MDEQFFSKRNYQCIYTILRKNLIKLINKNIDNFPDYKKRIVESMKYIYAKKDIINIPNALDDSQKSVYLSKHLIRILIQREQDILKKTNINDPITQPLIRSESTLKSDYTEDLNKKLENTQHVRREKPKGDINEFFQGNETINDEINTQLDDNSDIQSKYAEMTKTRQYQYENLDDGMRRPEIYQPIVSGNPTKVIEQTEMPEDNVNIDALLNLDDFQTISTPITPNEQLRPSFIPPKQVNTKSILSNTSLLVNKISEEESNILQNGIMGSKKKNNATIKSNIVIINSGDRDFKHLPENFNKYNFKMTFAGQQQNPYPNVPNKLRNIVEMTLTRVCIPRPYYYTSFPYLFLRMGGINSNIMSTHKSGRDVFAKVVFDKLFDSLVEYEDSSGRKIRHREFMYFINPDGEKLTFATPMASLDTLTLELLTPGYKNVQDYWVDSDVGWTDSGGISGGITNLSGITRAPSISSTHNDITFETEGHKITDRFLANSYVTDIIKNASTDEEYKLVAYTQQSGTLNNGTTQGSPALPPTMTFSDISDFRQNKKLHVPGEIQLVNMSNQIQYIFEIKTLENYNDEI